MNILNSSKGNKVHWGYFLGLWLCSMFGIAFVAIGLAFPNKSPEKHYTHEILVNDYKYFSSYNPAGYYGLYKYKIGSNEEPIKLSSYSLTSQKYHVGDKLVYDPHRVRGICIVDLKSDEVTLLEGNLSGPVVLGDRMFFVDTEKKRLMEFNFNDYTISILSDETYIGCRESKNLLVLRNEHGEDFTFDLVGNELKIVQ